MPKDSTSSHVNSLGFAKPPAATRVVVAMSGGVDSSVVAGLLAGEGYEVVGITLQLYDYAGRGDTPQKHKACCAGVDIHDARAVAARLGIRHFVLDYESRFRQQVMDDFADSYLRGETPIPCVRCNQSVKFADLLATARDLGADCLATGHYVRREIRDGKAALLRGRDPAKDQSYFLFATTQEQAEFLRFPLGDMNKIETRAHARRLGLKVAEKPDSQDICFVPNGRYGDVVRALRPGAAVPGDIVDKAGRVLGRHEGIIDYTIGQRRGLGIGGIAGRDEAPLYVIGLDAAANRVIVGERDDLARHRVLFDDVNWLGATPPQDGMAVLARLRHGGEAAPARITGWPVAGGGGDVGGGDGSGGDVGDGGGKGVAEITLDAPQYGIAGGQAAVLYDGDEPDRLLGGGWIVGSQ